MVKKWANNSLIHTRRKKNAGTINARGDSRCQFDPPFQTPVACCVIFLFNLPQQSCLCRPFGPIKNSHVCYKPRNTNGRSVCRKLASRTQSGKHEFYIAQHALCLYRIWHIQGTTSYVTSYTTWHSVSHMSWSLCAILSFRRHAWCW